MAPINQPSPEDCKLIYNLIGTSGIAILLLISELMPYFKLIKGNGIVHTIHRVLDDLIAKKETEQIDGNNENNNENAV